MIFRRRRSVEGIGYKIYRRRRRRRTIRGVSAASISASSDRLIVLRGQANYSFFSHGSVCVVLIFYTFVALCTYLYEVFLRGMKNIGWRLTEL